MSTIYQINQKMNDVAPCELSEEWDNDGIMLCGNLNQNVTKALICLDVTKQAIQKAIEAGANLIITHHPMIFRPLKSLTGEAYEKISLLIKNGISVLSYHTRLDSAQNGVNFALAKSLGLCNITAYGGHDGLCGRMGELEKECTIEEFVALLKSTIGAKSIRVGLCDKMHIKTVALLGGAGKDFLNDACKAGCDVFVTGEVPHNIFMESAYRNVYIVEAGHYFTENKICDTLRETLKNSFHDVEFITYNNGAPYAEL